LIILPEPCSRKYGSKTAVTLMAAFGSVDLREPLRQIGQMEHTSEHQRGELVEGLLLAIKLILAGRLCSTYQPKHAPSFFYSTAQEVASVVNENLLTLQSA